MKYKLLLFVGLFLSLNAFSQVEKTVHVATVGTLNSLMTDDEKQNITDLTVTGNIDARDVRIMRDRMTKLEKLNLFDVNIKAYTGIQGPNFDTKIVYPENEFPEYSFYNSTTGTGKRSLKTVILPENLTSVGEKSFYYSGLQNLILSNSINRVKEWAFYKCSISELSLPNSITRIDVYAFSNIPITKLSLSNNLKFIGHSAFSSTNITELVIPNSVTNLYGQTFRYSKKLKSIGV